MAEKNNVVKIAKSQLDRWGTAKRRASLLTQELVHLFKEIDDPEISAWADRANAIDLYCEAQYQAEFNRTNH